MLQLVLNMDRRRLQRAATVAGFYLAVASLGFLLIAQSINLGSSQLSAYDGGWDDLSTLRDDLNEMGIETRSLVSSPLVLNELDDARNTTLIISGVERNALALPQFDDSGFISFSGSDGYSLRGGCHPSLRSEWGDGAPVGRLWLRIHAGRSLRC